MTEMFGVKHIKISIAGAHECRGSRINKIPIWHSGCFIYITILNQARGLFAAGGTLILYT